MRLVASQLRDITNAVHKGKEDAEFSKILMDCLDSATMGREYNYIDLEYSKFSKQTVNSIIERLKDFNFKVEAKFNDEDGYVDITVRW